MCRRAVPRSRSQRGPLVSPRTSTSFDFELSRDQIEAIDALDTGARGARIQTASSLRRTGRRSLRLDWQRRSPSRFCPALGPSRSGRWVEQHAVARDRRVGALTAVEAAGSPLSRSEFRKRLFYPDRARVTVSG